MQHLRYLSEQIGSRPFGSAGNHEAATYIQRALERAGLEVTNQIFPCPNWELHEAFLQIDGGEMITNVLANRFTCSCDVTANTVALGTISELENADLRGKIAVLYGEIIRVGFIPKAFTIYNPERNQRLIRTLEDKSPLAIITVANTTENLMPNIRDWDFRIPSITVHPDVGLMLLENSGDVRLCIKSSTTRGYSQNVFGKKVNSRRDRIVLCAHYDTEFHCPGAVDNGAGVAVLLTLAERLCKMKLSTDLEFIAFSGEEFAALGEQEYLRSSPDFEKMLSVINIDGVGQSLGNNTVTAMSTSTHFKTELQRLRNEFPQVLWVDPWYESDHTIFASEGVPSIPMSSLGVKDIYHLMKDEVKWISPRKLDEVIHLVMRIVYMLQARPLEWFRQT
jgi:aminopeptidase YwaD